MLPVSSESHLLNTTGKSVIGGFLCSQDSEKGVFKSILSKEIEILQVNQAHGNNIATLFSESSVSTLLNQPWENRVYDGLVTDQAGYALTIRTADCVPILFHSKGEQPLIGALHCGWRSLASGIIENLSLVKNNNSNSDTHSKINDLIFSIGPAICQECYEVGEEVINEFRSMVDISAVSEPVGTGKFLLDMKTLSKLLLIRAGVPGSSITVSSVCTKCHPAYHSHRENQTQKRNLTFIAIHHSEAV